MSESTATAQELPAQDVEIAQPLELFDERLLPLREDLVERVRARSFLPVSPDPAKRTRHTGKIVIRQMLDDEELCEAICTALLAGLSARLVGRRFSLSPKSVANIRDAMEERGELAPVRTRIQRKLDRVTELGLECVEDALLAGAINPGQAWIPALATFDKREQASAGLVPGTDRTRASVTLEQVLAEHALARAKLSALASGATDTTAQTIDCQPAGALPAPPAPAPAPGQGPVDQPPAATAATPDGPADGHAHARDRAGGAANPAGAAPPRGDGPENFPP